MAEFIHSEEKRQEEECPLAFICSYHNTTEGCECAAYKSNGYRSCMYYNLVAQSFERCSE